MCYFREELQVSDTKLMQLNCSCSDLEMMWVMISHKSRRDIVVVNVYRPPQGDYKEASKLLNNAFTKANLKDNTDIFLMGDFNIDWKDNRSSAKKELEFLTGSLGLSPLIRNSTRYGVRQGMLSKSCIDLIFSNSNNIAEARVLDLNLSDHLAVYVRRKMARVKYAKVTFTGRSYRNFDKEQFQVQLLNHDWDDYYNAQNPSEAWGLLENTIRELLNESCPHNSFRVKEEVDPWISNELLEEIKDKNSLLKRARRTGKVEDWIEAKRARNEVGSRIRREKMEFLTEQQREFAGDPKKFWKSVSKLVPNKKGNSGKINLTDETNKKQIDEADTADYINNFFSTIGEKLAENFTDHWQFFDKIQDESCEPLSTDFQQVMKLCKEINTCKSSGIEDISTRVFKHAFMVLIPQLVYLFNLSFSTGLFPDSWKRATVIPLFKGGDRAKVGNYRPVSLLPLPGKIIEKIVHNRLSAFLENRNILSNYQSGFRKGFSNVSSVADFTDAIFSGINEQETTMAVFIDLRKAFDTVNHEILCRKLCFYGINSMTLDWCKNYLANRTQTTLANNNRSVPANVSCGVPQGSVLGPLFFILYINDMQNALGSINLSLYADDTVLYVTGKNLGEMKINLEFSLKLFEGWCRANKLTLNPAKTKMVNFGTRHYVKKAKDVKVTLSNAELQVVPTYKYLGVTLDSTLSLQTHLKNVTNTVIHKLSILCKVRRYLTEKAAISVYKSMILPYFDYCDIIYDASNKGQLDRLQRLQNKCLKVCMRLERRHETENVHVRAHLPRLGVRREAHLCNFMFKRKEAGKHLNTRNVRTRLHDAPVFDLGAPNNETYKRSVKYKGARTWNSLPADVRNINSYEHFKAHQKRNMFVH